MGGRQVELKECSKCRLAKPLDQFSPHARAKNGVHAYCKSCRVKDAQNKKEALKKIVYDYYGRECCCCHETEPLFLTLDHINNDGAEHRRTLKGNKILALYQFLIDNDFPSTVQVLCCNCNRGKWLNGGICPHAK